MREREPKLVTFKLTTGEEIVGTLVEQGLTSWTIKDPCYAKLGFDTRLDSQYMYFEKVAWLSKENTLSFVRGHAIFQPVEVRPEVGRLYDEYIARVLKATELMTSPLDEEEMAAGVGAMADRIATGATTH